MSKLVEVLVGLAALVYLKEHQEAWAGPWIATASMWIGGVVAAVALLWMVAKVREHNDRLRLVQHRTKVAKVKAQNKP